MQIQAHEQGADASTRPSFLAGLFAAIGRLFGKKAAPTGGATTKPRQKVMLVELTEAQVAEGLVLKTEREDPESVFLEQQFKEVTSLVEGRKWYDLNEKISDWDLDGEVSSTGVRLGQGAIDYVWQSVTHGAEGNDLLADLPKRMMEEVENAQKELPDDYVLAALLARMKIGTGWAMRGDRPAQDTPPETKEKVEEEFAAAAEAILPFDPVELHSPLVARLRYDVLAGLGLGAEELQNALDTLIELDPGNLDVYRAHGRFMLPKFYGDMKVLDLASRRILGKTETDLGAAAYAAMFQVAIQSDESSLAVVDLDLYEAGLTDIISLARDDQMTVNRICNDLMNVGSVRRSLTSTDSEEVAAKRAEIRLILKNIMREHLKVLLPHLWQWDEPTVRQNIAELFAAEILAGEKVVLGAAGMAEAA